MTGCERRHLRSVTPPSHAGEDPEPPDPEDPEPPDEDVQVLLW